MKNNYSKVKWPKLPKVFKRKWVKALRSGKYKQGTGYLLSGEKYCCLGVACTISSNDEINGAFISVDNTNVPEELRGNTELANFLSSMNDGDFSHSYEDVVFYHRESSGFAQIANFIEKYL